MASYLILGRGKFGRLALERLSRQSGGASFLVVDRDPQALVSEESEGRCRQVQAEATTFLAQNLKDDGRWDWIIPMVPVHVAYQWLLAGSGWQPIPVPEVIEQLLAGTRRGASGELYLSRAQHLCPDDCAEPEICPVTGEVRDLPLHQELASLKLPGYQVKVISSQQLAPGVGGYAPAQLLQLARDLKDQKGQVLIATACRCHGVMHGLRRSEVT
jgi:hypothetical protein